MAIEFTSDVDCKLVVQSFTRPGLEWDATPEDLRAAGYVEATRNAKLTDLLSRILGDDGPDLEAYLDGHAEAPNVRRLYEARDSALSGEQEAVARAESAELGCEIAYRREPTAEEGDAHEFEHHQSVGPAEKSGECHVPMGNWHGHRCTCGKWVWGGGTVCQGCVDAQAVRTAVEQRDTARAEVDKLLTAIVDALNAAGMQCGPLNICVGEARANSWTKLLPMVRNIVSEAERLRAEVERLTKLFDDRDRWATQLKTELAESRAEVGECKRALGRVSNRGCVTALDFAVDAHDQIVAARAERDQLVDEVEACHSALDSASVSNVGELLRDRIARALSESTDEVERLKAEMAGRDTKAVELPYGIAPEVWVNGYDPNGAGYAYTSKAKCCGSDPLMGPQHYVHESLLTTARAEGAAEEREELLQLIHIAHDFAWSHADVVERIRARGKR